MVHYRQKRGANVTEPFTIRDTKYLLADGWSGSAPGLTAGITTKNGGTSTGCHTSLNMGFHVNDRPEAVLANREALAETLGFPLHSWAGAQQTHETIIKKIEKKDAGKGAADYDSAFAGTDGVYTAEKGILLTLCFADCVPLFFSVPKRGLIGAAHAGWKGTAGGIAGEMVKALRGEGADPEDIHVLIGPSICSSCYAVDDKVIEKVQKLLEEHDEKPYNLISKGQYSLDLKQANALVLKKAGIPAEQIGQTSFCTSCDRDLFFSYRRDKGCSGRIMSFIGWKEDLKGNEGYR